MEYFNIEIKGREMRPGYIVYVVQLIHPTFGVYFYVGQTGDRKYTTARPALRRFAGHLSDRGYVTENQVYRAVAVKILGFEEGKNRKAFSKEIKQGVSEFFDRAKTVMHVGGIGSGCVGKVTHNCAIFSLEQAMLECLTLGVKAGVSPKAMVKVFQKAALGRNMGLHVRLPATLFKGDFEARFALSIAHKDMLLAKEMAQTHDVPMAVTDVTERAMKEAVDRGWENLDSSIFLTLQEELAGVEIRI